MRVGLSRRRFLYGSAAAASAAAWGDLSRFMPLSPAGAAAAPLTPDVVRFTPEIEPVVRAIEDASQENCMEVMAALLRAGLPYRNFLAALFLAGVRNPAVSHTPLVTHAVHQLALDAPAGERLLPTFWALANFKYWQNYHSKEDYRMPPLGGELPRADEAAGELRAAMDGRPDADRAERAAVALVRSEGTGRVFDTLWPYAAVNCLSIYHSAISLGNSWRTLQTIGWQHAEPMVRWLTRSFATASSGAPLLNRGDWTYRENRRRAREWAGKLPAGWAGGAGGDGDAGLTGELLARVRDFSADDACELVVTRLAAGRCQAAAVWDAVHLAACELMMRRPDFGYPLHSNTGANALRYGFRTSADPEVRLLLLLQAVGWQCHARKRLAEIAKADAAWAPKPVRIDELAGDDIPADPAAAAEEIFAGLPTGKDRASARVFRLAERTGHPREFFASARRMLFTKLAADETHDMKYPVALFEDYELVSPRWRPHLLASSVYWLPGSEKPDSPVMRQAAEAVRRI